MKVTRQVYKEIKARLQEAPGHTQAEVAKQVGVAQSTVDRVVKSRNYKNYHELIKEGNLRQAKLREFKAYNAQQMPDWIVGDNGDEGMGRVETTAIEVHLRENKKELLRLLAEISRHMDNMRALIKQAKGGLKWPKNE